MKNFYLMSKEEVLKQFADLLVVILIVAAIISMLSGNTESTIVIFAVIIMNAILGTVQHKKAEKSLDSLKSLSSPNAKVLRDGIKVEVPSKDIVPGDIVLLEAGDMVVVTGTGMDTEIGKIAAFMNATKEKKTPLQISLDQFSSRLAIVIMIDGKGKCDY